MISPSEAMEILSDSGCTSNVIEHCRVVSELAVGIAQDMSYTGRPVDVDLVEVGAILHDLGRSRTHDIDHAVVGAEMAADMGLGSDVIQIIKFHIGAGIPRFEAVGLGLPDEDYIPMTMEEKIVAHADNLVKGTECISLDERLSLMKLKSLNEMSIVRVKALADEFVLTKNTAWEKAYI